MVLANVVSSVLVMNTEFQRLYSVITSSNKDIKLTNQYRALKDLQDDTNLIICLPTSTNEATMVSISEVCIYL